MTTVRIELNSAGIRELLSSADVQRDLDARAERVADAARAQGVRVSGEPGDVAMPVVTYAAGDSTRARALVVAEHAAALATETKHRLLGSSLDAAR